MTRKLGLGAAGATALVMLVAGCGSSSSSVKPASNSGSGQSPLSGSAAGLQTKSTSIGTVLVNPAGRTVYELVGDSASKQTCTGSCLVIWPAVMANGSQVVVNGHPAFTFSGDTAPGQTKGQNLTDQWGLWLALDASGNPIKAAAGGSTAPASQAPASSQAPNGGGAAF